MFDLKKIMLRVHEYAKSKYEAPRFTIRDKIRKFLGLPRKARHYKMKCEGFHIGYELPKDKEK